MWKANDVSGSDETPADNPFTRRENDVLRLICQGLSNAEIAAQLHLTHGTVKWYASQIYGKIDVTTRAQAIARVHELGLISADDSPAPTVPDAPKEPQPDPRQKIRVLRSFDGAAIAYSVSGEGPPLVEVAHMMSHLVHSWDSPIYQHLLREFMRDHKLIRYDQRGVGLSDWTVEDQSFEAWVRDLEAVVDATGAERFPLFGKSMAGSVAIAYAARHPDRVSKLILLGAYACGYAHLDLSLEESELVQAKFAMLKVGWNQINPAFRRFVATNEFPNGSIELVREMESIIENSSSADNLIHIGRTNLEVDVRDLARQIHVPTLIFHARNDQVVSFDRGLEVASLIPDAQFVPLDTMNHLLVEGEPAWHKFQQSLRAFLKT